MTDLYHHLTLFLREIKKTGEKPLVVVCGPTASGKTAMSLRIAEEFNGEIISADSAQVYRKMDIGSDKVSRSDRQKIKHYLVDVRDINQLFTMADFKREATHAIGEILAKGKLPIICGGTGLYINSVVENYELPLAPPNPKIREELEREYTRGGSDGLYNMLLDLDAVTASKIHPNNVRYVARALEIVLQTKEPLEQKKGKPLYSVFKMAVDWPREILYERINRRVDEQIDRGLLNELKTLLTEGYAENAQAFSALGYKEYFPYLRGEKPLEECKEELKMNSRNFAKRQLTWFRKEEDIFWIQPEEFTEVTSRKPNYAPQI